jgi:gamma-glutamyl-gamma-aminobutyrate hydrolase PuuD
MPADRPLIGVAVGRIPVNDRVVDGTQRDYGDRIADAGGFPLLLLGRSDLPLGAVLPHLDGLLLPGGGDIAPEVYGAEPVAEIGGVDIERDRAEIALFDAGLAAGLPILAVCRGIQLVNVARGGTLVQHLPAVTSEPHLIVERRRELVHTVHIEPESELGNIIGAQDLDVNSLHHQAVDRVGRGLRAVAWAEDGIIEGLEDRDRRVIAVQWHPEQLPDEAPEMRLFAWLIEQAGQRLPPRERAGGGSWFRWR